MASTATNRFFFFFNDTATTEIYTLSLHDALPICRGRRRRRRTQAGRQARARCQEKAQRSEEHTSELQSQSNLVCRLLLEKKKHLVPRLSAIATAIDAARIPTVASW